MEDKKYFITLKAARVNAELTQAELAEKLGVSPLTILSWESKKTKIPIESLMKLCEICCVRADDIINWLLSE